MLLSAVLFEAEQRLRQAQIEEPKREARLLLSFVLGKDVRLLSLDDAVAFDVASRHVFQALIERRAKGEPFAYLTGRREFFGRDFYVSPAVLIPRPDTETLVQAVLDYVLSTDIHVADLGVGSGAILLTLLAERSPWTGLGVDISSAAIEVARCNATALGLDGCAQFLCADAATLSSTNVGAFDVVVSNPPYISGDEMTELARDVRDYEPHQALFGGDNGYEAYRTFVPAAWTLLKEGGVVFLEIGASQALSVSKILESSDFERIEIFRDLAGHDRVLRAQKRSQA